MRMIIAATEKGKTMARLIDADALLQEHCEGCTAHANGLCSFDDPVCGAAMLITEAPTVDAVEVVRCKDCKNYYRVIGRGDNEIWGCRFMGRDTAPNAFCSYGERKDDE